jgi:hypothetical protein
VQKEVGLHAALLKFYVDVLGVRILKAHRAWRWKQSKWLSPYISDLSGRRASSNDPVAREVLKLTMNALYGMFLQNKALYKNTGLYVSPEAFAKAIDKDNVVGRKVFADDPEGFLGLVHRRGKRDGLIDTPRLVGLCILELSKLKMYSAHYLFFKPTYGRGALLCYMDTDSLIYGIETEDIVQDLLEANRDASCPVIFDLSQVEDPKVKGLPASDINKGLLGAMKLELKDGHIKEYAGPQAKVYSLQRTGKDETKAKGIPGKKAREIPLRDAQAKALAKSKRPREVAEVPRAVENPKALRHERYLSEIFAPKPSEVDFLGFACKNHLLSLVCTTKKGLCSFNDKVHQHGQLDSVPLGHYRVTPACAPPPPAPRTQLQVRRGDAVPGGGVVIALIPEAGKVLALYQNGSASLVDVCELEPAEKRARL